MFHVQLGKIANVTTGLCETVQAGNTGMNHRVSVQTVLRIHTLLKVYLHAYLALKIHSH